MKYSIQLLRSGQFLFSGHDRKSQFRKAGTVIVDCDRDLALWLYSCGHGRLYEGDLPSSPEQLEYLNPALERSRRNKIRRAKEDFLIQCATAQEQSNQQP